MEYWIFVNEVGCAGGIGVAVMAKQGRESELYVKLTATHENFTTIGQTFIGKNALRDATCAAEAALSVLQAAQATWEVPAEECDT